jgi:hypothetical protein
MPRMRPALPLLLSALVCLAAPAARAQAAPASAESAEPRVQRIVQEDDQVRVDELRVRGQTQRITVRPKAGGRAYEVVPATAAHDPSGNAKGSSGQRVWQLFSF